MSTSPATEAEKKQPPSLVYLATIIGSLSVVLIAILTNGRAFLEQLAFNVVIVIFSAAIFIVVAYGLVMSPLLPRIRGRLRENRQELIASEILPDLADLIDKFIEAASTQYTTGIHSAIQSFQITGVPARRP
jgi:hypothetical protein